MNIESKVVEWLHEQNKVPIAKRYLEAHEKGLRQACKLLAMGNVEQSPCAQFDKTFSFCKFNEDEVCQYEDDPELCWYEYLAGYWRNNEQSR